MLALRMDVDFRVNLDSSKLWEKMKEQGGAISVMDLVKDFYQEGPEGGRIFSFNERTHETILGVGKLMCVGAFVMRSCACHRQLLSVQGENVL